MPDLNPQQFDYRMAHRPSEEGPGLHEVEKAYPDVHEHPEYYTGFGHPTADRQTIAVARATRGKPDAPVTMYRAAPRGVTQINPGDWVTPSRAYAQNHADAEGSLVVHAAPTTAANLRATGDYIHEFGYAGSSPVPVRRGASR